ncbi:MAG: hypothetical protein WCL06_04890 [Bacteroidota bacterium]
MYIDLKVALWKRIQIPNELEEEFMQKLIDKEIISSEDAILFLASKTQPIKEKLSDSLEPIRVENNEGEATFQIFDNNKNLIFSNDNKP